MVVQFCQACGEVCGVDFQRPPQFILKTGGVNPEPVTLCDECWDKLSNAYYEIEQDVKEFKYVRPEPEVEDEDEGDEDEC